LTSIQFLQGAGSFDVTSGAADLNGRSFLAGNTVGEFVDWASPAVRGDAVVAPAADLDEETDAIVAVTPRAHRASARSAVPVLLMAARTGGITHLRRIAYLLATALYDSQFGAHLVEPGSGTFVDGRDRTFERFEPHTELGQALGNTLPGDGERFRGRGFVPVRGRAAYAAWSKRLELPDIAVNGTMLPFFVAHPAAMARPQIAAQTIVRGMRDGIFTGIALGMYVNDKKTDFYNARRTVDGLRGARDVAAYAEGFARALDAIAMARHEARMHDLARARAGNTSRDFVAEIGEAVERLAARGEIMPPPIAVIDWDGEARQGKFVQLDEHTCALHMGRGTYVRLDVQRDLNGVTPPEGRNVALKRSGDVQPAVRNGNVYFWR